MQKYSISQLGKEVGVTAKTIRYYEDIGLIKPAEREENGYRVYGELAKEELVIIKKARDLGLPINKIKKLTLGCECQGKKCNHTKEEVIHDINEHVDLLNEKIKQFTILKKKLQLLSYSLEHDKRNCDSGRYCCNILYQLISLQEGGEKNEP